MTDQLDTAAIRAQMKAPKLLPCPFCGGKNVSVFGPVGWDRKFGIRHTCSVFYGGSGEFTIGARSRVTAISDWNSRADIITAQAEGNQRLRKALTAPDTKTIRAHLSDGAYPIGWGHATILTLCDEVERLRAFIADFAGMKIEAIYPPPDPRDPCDVGDPVTDYMTIEALQEDARAALTQPTGDRP